MAGLTPFQFSSRRRQDSVTMGYSGTAVGGFLADLMGWYEMWINPESVRRSRSYKQAVNHTAGSIVTFHYRPENQILTCNGKCGWVRIHSILEEAKAGILNNAIHGKMNAAPLDQVKDNLPNPSGSIAAAKEGKIVTPWDISSSHSNRFDNSPLTFLKRLKTMADEPMYYTDSDGVDHYNTKYIKLFTKENPEGVIYDGYFTSFEINEEVDLGETIAYSFQFVIENETPVTIVQRVLGAYAGYGSAIGDVTSIVSGI